MMAAVSTSLSPTSAPTQSSASLSRSELIFYGLPFAGYLAMSLPVSMWLLKFSTDTLLIAPATMGLLFAIGRIWDAISDPMAGYLSDRTQSPLGRRRIWLYGSAIPLGLTYVMLWSPPIGLDQVEVVIWVGLAMLLWETASTAFYIPYAALGLELTTDYHERTRLFGWRQMLMTLGFGASLVVLYLIRTADDPRELAFLTSSGTAVVAALLIFICAGRTREPAHHQGRGSQKLSAAFRDVSRNPHARILFLVLGIDSFGIGIIAALGAFIIDDLVGRVDLMEIMMAVWMIPQFVLVPIWMRISNRVGKKRLWIGGMLTTICGFLGMLALDGGDWMLVLFCVLMVGIGTSVSQVMSPSIQADIVDWDEHQSGERKEGAYVAVWNFLRKAGAAGAAGLGGLALSLAGYDALAEEQSELVKDAIRLTCGLIPAIAFVIALLIFRKFSLNEAEHALLKRDIEAREAR